MRPIFEYDHARGVLLVRLDVSEDYDKAPRTLFAVDGDPMETRHVAPGAEPPLYCAPIHDGDLIDMVAFGVAWEYRAAGGTWSSDPFPTLAEAREALASEPQYLGIERRRPAGEWEEIE